VAGDVLDDRQHAAGQQALGGGAPQGGHLFGRIAIGAIADDLVTLGIGHVQHRHAVDIDADGPQVVSDQARAQAGDLTRHQRIVGHQFAIGAAGRILFPMGGSKAGDAAALLVDQDRGVGAADRVAQRLGQGQGLLGRVDIALEQDEAPRLHVPEEVFFLARQSQAGAAEDRGGGAAHLTKQDLPAAEIASQNALAASRLAKPVTEVR
jgi:hypothetical protein